MNHASIKLSLIAAVSQNGVIGRDGDLPFRLSSDLKNFKKITMGKPLIMGRKTFESIGKPLPGRPNLVLTRQDDYSAEGVEVFQDLDIMLDRARVFAEGLNVSEICCIGGGELYQMLIDEADLLRITHVDMACEGDVSFPEILKEKWSVVNQDRVAAGEKDEAGMRFVTYERRKV